LKHPTWIQNNRGFTLLELVIALGLSGIVVYAAGTLMTGFFKRSKQLNDKISLDVSEVNLKHSFSLAFQLADVAKKYQHLPIPISNCANDLGQPCLRQMNEKGGFESTSVSPELLASSGVTPQAIEFFRDDEGASIEAIKAYGDPQSDWVQGTRALHLSPSALSGNGYVTWPLIDETSQPWSVLLSSGNSVSLKFDEMSDPQGIPIRTLEFPYTFFKSTHPISSSDLSEMSGSLVLVSDAYHPQYYYFQWVDGMPLDCREKSSEGKSKCIPFKYWTHPEDTVECANYRFLHGIENCPSILLSQPPKEAVSAYEYALKLRPLTESESFLKLIPQLSEEMKRKISQQSWQHQEPSFYLFLTQIPSLYNMDNLNYQRIAITPNRSLDVRNWANYLASTKKLENHQLVVKPVQFKSFYLKKKVTIAPESLERKSSYQLVSTTFHHQTQDFTTRFGIPENFLHELGPDKKVMIVRKLGTSNFSVLITSSNGGKN
jgi:prepilin-type N-terminal cleavage/methylation domain-containing protein